MSGTDRIGGYQMGDYIRRILIAAIMLLFISLLFLGGKHSQAQSFSLAERTKTWTCVTAKLKSTVSAR